MSARPSRRRGRLTEGQEAAAKELRELREGGGKRTDAHEDAEDADIYEEVDEREFESRAAGDRQEAHDFIEDDGVFRRPPPPCYARRSPAASRAAPAATCRSHAAARRTAEGIGYLNEDEEEDLDEETGSKRGRTGGGKDSKKQRTGDSSLPQSMLSSFLRKGVAPVACVPLSCLQLSQPRSLLQAQRNRPRRPRRRRQPLPTSTRTR